MHWPENETGIGDGSRVGNNNAALSVVVDTAGHTPAHTHGGTLEISFMETLNVEQVQ